MGVFDLVTCRTWHFAGMKFISQDCFYVRDWKGHLAECLRLTMSLLPDIWLCHRQSSLTVDRTCSGRSLMYGRKRMGPRTEPCGTQEDTGMLSELIPLITTVTDCFLLSKKPLIHFSVSPPNAVKMQFLKKFFMGNLVKSFTKV